MIIMWLLFKKKKNCNFEIQIFDNHEHFPIMCKSYEHTQNHAKIMT